MPEPTEPIISIHNDRQSASRQSNKKRTQRAEAAVLFRSRRNQREKAMATRISELEERLRVAQGRERVLTRTISELEDKHRHLISRLGEELKTTRAERGYLRTRLTDGKPSMKHNEHESNSQAEPSLASASSSIQTLQCSAQQPSHGVRLPPIDSLLRMSSPTNPPRSTATAGDWPIDG